MLDVFVDADACPVKQEIYKVARRYNLKVILVSNSWMRTPEARWIELVVVDKGADVADNWIVDHVQKQDLVISGDIPLASRCIKKGAQVLGHTGRPFTEDNIANALAVRNLLADLRDEGIMTKGPKPFSKKDRSQFLQSMDEMIVKTIKNR